MRKTRWFSLSVALGLLIVGVVVAAAFPYRIQYGDTLYSLARRNNTSVADIVASNAIADPNLIYAGETIEIPAASANPAPASMVASATGVTSAARTHMVSQGDTLYGIARRYGTSVDAIAQANDIRNVDYVPVGKLLLIPGDFGQIHALTPRTTVTATLGVQSGDACGRINFLSGRDSRTGSRTAGTYVISEFNGRGGLASWKAQAGDIDSGWIYDINISFPSVHVVVSFYPADGSPPFLMRIVNPVSSDGYGWLASGVCNAIEIEYPS